MQILYVDAVEAKEKTEIVFLICILSITTIIQEGEIRTSNSSKYTIFNMVFILDGCSFCYAHIWSKSGISI